MFYPTYFKQMPNVQPMTDLALLNTLLKICCLCVVGTMYGIISHIFNG